MSLTLFIRTLLLTLLGCLPIASGASVIHDLYNTRVAVASQTVAAQNEAIRNSFNQVLIKVSGNKDIVSAPQIRASQNSAQDLIQSFRFETTVEGSFMVASFDEEKINQLLTDSGHPVWGKRRPDTLLWIAWLNEQGEREIITAGSQNPIKKSLLHIANSRGIPVTFPLLDIEDAEMIHVFDVWGRFDSIIKRASQRYPNDNLVSARVYDRRKLAIDEQEVPSSMIWQLDWQVLNDDLIEEGSWFGSNDSQVLQKFIDMLADRLAAQYAVVSSGDRSQTTISMKIINLNDIETYVAATRFLGSLAMVSNIKLISLVGEVATFELEVLGQQQDLINTLQLDARIAQKTDAFGRVLDDMEFLWLQ